jgi:hypothetical protein
VTGDDYARLGADAELLVTFIGNQAFMRIEHDGAAEPIGRCAALTIDARDGSYLCSIYDRRPDVCRALERGSPACDGERGAKADRPRRALRVLTPPA